MSFGFLQSDDFFVRKFFDDCLRKTLLHKNKIVAHNKNMKQKNKKQKSKFISNTDPLGSYTGNPIDGGQPVQDADDL